MGGCASKQTKAETFDSYRNERESALNSRGYKMTNPTALRSTTNTNNAAFQTQATTQRQQHSKVSNLENSAKAKRACTQTMHENVETNSEAHQMPIQNKNSITLAEVTSAKQVRNINKKPPAQSKLRNSKQCATPSTSDVQSKAGNGQNKALAIKTKAAGPNKNKRSNNHVTKSWRTRENWRNELHINRKDMKEFFELLKCPICYQRIHGPIQKCVVGHFICKTCRSKLDRDRCPVCQSDMSNERMIMLENMIEIISMKCPYGKFGCRHAASPVQMQQHMEECPFRVISCVDAKCSWEGKLEHITFHFINQHSDKVFQKPSELSIPSARQDYTHTYLVRFQYHNKFFCRFKVCNATNALSISVQCPPVPKDKAEEWTYRLTLLAGIKRLVYPELKVHKFKNTDSLNDVDKSLILPLNEVELFEEDGLIKYKIWFTEIDGETATSALDGYCDVKSAPAEVKMKSEKC